MEQEIKQLPLPFDTLPHVINQMIGSYMEYEDRMNFSRVLLSVDDKYTKKLDSDAHNLAVKANLVRDKIRRFEEKPFGSIQRLELMKSMFLYFLHTKDTCLFTKTHKGLRDVMINRALTHTNFASFHTNLRTNHRREVKSMIRVSEKLLSYLESLPPAKLKFDHSSYVRIR